MQLPKCSHTGVINPQEVEEHRQSLKRVVEELKKCTEEKKIQEVMQKLIEDVKEAYAKVHTQMTEASISNVLHSIRDPYSLALRQATEGTENRLESIMPEEELPKGDDVVHMVQNIEPTTQEIKDFMDHTAEAYYQAGLAAE